MSEPDEAVRAYAAQHRDVEAATVGYVAEVSALLDDAGINYLTVTGRAKTVESFAAKAARTADGRPVYPDPLQDITDQVGVRVITYLHSDVTAVADVLADHFVVLDDRDMGQETASEGRFGYASRHLLVTARKTRGPSERAAQTRAAQVQIRTVLQHAWAEFEHDIRYKGNIPAEHAPELDRRFTLAAGLLELADREFSIIRERLRAGGELAHEAEGHERRIAGQDLAAFLDSRFEGSGWSRTDHYDWICTMLAELGITTIDELAGFLSTIDTEMINARMGYRYPPGAVRRLDDALLAVFGPRYIGLEGNAKRVSLLTVRLDKLRADPGQGAPSGTADSPPA